MEAAADSLQCVAIFECGDSLPEESANASCAMNDTTTRYSWQIDKYVLIGEQGALNRVWQSESEDRALTVNYHPHEHRVTVNHGRDELESLLVGGEDMHPLAWSQDRQFYVVKRNQLDGSTISKFRIYFCSAQDCCSFVNRMPEIWEIRQSEKPTEVQSTQAGSIEATDWNDLSAFYNPPQFPPIPEEVQRELETLAAEVGGDEDGEGTSGGDEDDNSGEMCSPQPDARDRFDAMSESVLPKKLPSMKPKKRKRPKRWSQKKPKPAVKTGVDGASSSKTKNTRLPTVADVGDGVLTRRMSALQADTSGRAADAAPTEQAQRHEQKDTNTAELIQAVSAILPEEWCAEDVATLAADLDFDVDFADLFNDSTANALDFTDPTQVDYDDLFTTWTPTMSTGSPDSGAERGGPTPADGAMDSAQVEQVAGASVNSERQEAVADSHLEEERSESLGISEDSSPGSIDSQASIELGAPIAGPSNIQLLAADNAPPGSPPLLKAVRKKKEYFEVLSDVTIGLIANYEFRSMEEMLQSLGEDKRGQLSAMKTRSGRTLIGNPAREDASKPPTKRPPPATRNVPTTTKRRGAKRKSHAAPHHYEMREKRPRSRLLTSDEYQLGR